MFSYMLSLVKLKLCGMVHQGSVTVRVSGSHLDMHTKLEDISHDIYQKTQQNKTPNRTLSVDIESTMNPFFSTSFFSKTLS